MQNIQQSNKILAHRNTIYRMLKHQIEITHVDTARPENTQANRMAHHAIAKGIPLDVTNDELHNILQKKYGAEISKTTRIHARINGAPTSFVRVICRTKETAQDLITNGLKYNAQLFQCEESIDKPRTVRCYHCWGPDHIQQNCPKRDIIICPRCGQNNCGFESYEGKAEEFVCRNERRGRLYCTLCEKESDHSPRSNQCPTWLEHLKGKAIQEKENNENRRKRIAETEAITKAGKSWAAVAAKQHSETSQNIHQIMSQKIEEINQKWEEKIKKLEEQINTKLNKAISELHNELATKEDLNKRIEKAETAIFQSMEHIMADAMICTLTHSSDLVKAYITAVRNPEQEIPTLDGAHFQKILEEGKMRRSRQRIENLIQANITEQQGDTAPQINREPPGKPTKHGVQPPQDPTTRRGKVTEKTRTKEGPARSSSGSRNRNCHGD